MDVYITFEKDGLNGELVEWVFSTEEAAQNWVIKSKFGLNMAYADMEKHELEEKALEHIEQHEVQEVEPTA